MKPWIVQKLSGCALTLTSWPNGLRGIPTNVRPLSKYAAVISDNSLSMIHTTKVADNLKSEMAEGMIDGASRYLDGERPADMQARSA